MLNLAIPNGFFQILSVGEFHNDPQTVCLSPPYCQAGLTTGIKRSVRRLPVDTHQTPTTPAPVAQQNNIESGGPPAYPVPPTPAENTPISKSPPGTFFFASFGLIVK